MLPHPSHKVSPRVRFWEGPGAMGSTEIRTLRRHRAKECGSVGPGCQLGHRWRTARGPVTQVCNTAAARVPEGSAAVAVPAVGAGARWQTCLPPSCSEPGPMTRVGEHDSPVLPQLVSGTPGQWVQHKQDWFPFLLQRVLQFEG